MKLRRFTSLAVTAAMTMSTAAMVAMPTASAEDEVGPQVNTATEFSENFESYGELNQSNTLLTLKDSGWYACDQTKLYTTVSTSASPYKDMGGKLANIATVDGSKALRIVTAGQRTDGASTDYGYGRALPGVAVNGKGTGVYKIQFDFKPIATSGKTQFYFGLNTADGSASGTAAQHNLVSGAGTNFYTGYRDYMTLYNGNIAQGMVNAADTTYAGGLVWYTVKAVVDCDSRYYSVELYNKKTGKLVSRRSPVSFAGSENVGFIKFSALGLGNCYAFYLDNISILANQPKENTIYNETFDSYSNDGYSASSGVTIGGETEDLAGNSYFEGYTPWRALSSSGNYYELTTGPDDSPAVRLGSSTTGATNSSGLVYMPVKDKLVTPMMQAARGNLRVSFTIKPDAIGDKGYQVYFSPEYNNTGAKAFEIVKKDDKIYIVKGINSSQEIDPSKWYEVELTFDVFNNTVDTRAREYGTSAVLSFSTEIPSLTAVKGLLFNAIGTTSVVLDDVNIRYTGSTTGVYAAISSVKATNTATLQDFIDGKNISVYVDWCNFTEENKNIALVLSYFDADDHFLGYQHVQRNDALQAGKYSSNQKISIDAKPTALHGVSGNAGGTPAKVMVGLWDGVGGSALNSPYCDAVVFEAEPAAAAE